MSQSHESATRAPPTKVELSESPVNVKFVEKEVALPLTQLLSAEELMQVMGDAIEGHREAYELYGTLHKDICPANIRIHNGRGLLLDWEFTEKKEERPKCAAFMQEVRWDDLLNKLHQRLRRSSTGARKDSDDDMLVDDNASNQIPSAKAAGSGPSLKRGSPGNSRSRKGVISKKKGKQSRS